MEITLLQQPMVGLADHLSARTEAILSTWRTVCEADPLLPTALILTDEEFRDNVPNFLKALAYRLRREIWQAEPMMIAREHGLQRWHKGYSLQELLTEIAHLHQCLEEELKTFWVLHPIDDPAIMLQAHQLVSKLVHEAINGSVTQYNDLQKINAAERATDLEQTLSEINDLVRRRGSMLRMASHDLRGSFGVMRGAAYILDQPGNTDEERAEMVQMLQRNFDRVTTMLTQLMDLARLEAGQESLYVQSFDAADLLRRVADSVRPLADERDLFLKTNGPARMTVRGDSVKVHRIAQNLLLNALRYTQTGGVTLSWEADDKNRWQLIVDDTGPGLPLSTAPESVSILSDLPILPPETPGVDSAVAQTNSPASGNPVVGMQRQAKGEGIGLHIVKRLCDLLNATMSVESKPGIGTRFHIRLPMHYAKS